MIPKTKTVFISYKSSDASKVDKIAHDLSLLRDADGNPRYVTWQDKHNLPPASPNWWDAIVDAIIDCDMFVFNLSFDSLQSSVCLAELDYANKRNRPIIPVVLENEFTFNPQSDRYGLPKATWDLIPAWLKDQQFLFYTGADFYRQFQEAVELFERKWPRDIHAPRPMNPDENSIHGSNHALYDAACDYAQRCAFADAEKHFSALVRRNDEDYANDAAEWLEIIRFYAELIEIKARPNARYKFPKKWADYQALFPKFFLDGIFDPQNFAGEHDAPASEAYLLVDESAATELLPAKQSNQADIPDPDIDLMDLERLADLDPMAFLEALANRQSDSPPSNQSPPTPSKPTSLALMPQPFDWIKISAGKGILKTSDDDVTLSIPEQDYWIGKYPVTNAQFAKFIEAGGYENERWWTEQGWQARLEGWHYDGGWKPSGIAWTLPRYWDNAKFNQPEQPVVGISWYESVAFCRWLSELTGETIMLPTEAQWQYAAQGTDGRTYPWGNEWDVSRANSDEAGIGKTSPVTRYEGKGIVLLAWSIWPGMSANGV